MHFLLRLFLRAAFPVETQDWVLLAADLVAIATIPSVLLRRRGRPMAALSWILALLAIPVGGVVAWWLLGRTHLHRPVRKRRRTRKKLEPPPASGAPPAPEIPAVLREVLPFALHGDRRHTEGVFPPARVRDVRVYGHGGEAFAAIEAAIAAARTEIRALYYIWQPGDTGRRIAEQLAAKARSGVKVRILVDEVGSRPFLRKLAPQLRAAGVEVAGFLPASFRPWAPTFNFRNHRKLLLVDGRVAFAGGINIGREYERDWQDQCLRLSGPVLPHLDEVFQEDWVFATNRSLDDLPADPAAADDCGSALCAVIASGPDRDAPRVHDAYFLAIAQARRRVWLTSPYFVPNTSVLDAIRSAALRGVDVRILTPRKNDVRLVALASRSYHEALLRAGVRLFEYQPRFLHTKNLIVDDELAVTGSANVDVRSFRLNFELACFLVSPEVNATLATLFEADLAKSHEIDAAEVARRGPIQRCLESGANLLSPLL